VSDLVLHAKNRPSRHVPHRVVQFARWWSSATKAQRFEVCHRIFGQKETQKGDPTLAEFRLAIFLAEANAGEIETG
jgi:hypothetical protein